MLLSYSRILVRKKRGHSSVVEYLTAEGVWQQTGAKQLRKSREGHHRQGREYARPRDAHQRTKSQEGKVGGEAGTVL